MQPLNASEITRAVLGDDILWETKKVLGLTFYRERRNGKLSAWIPKLPWKKPPIMFMTGEGIDIAANSESMDIPPALISGDEVTLNFRVAHTQGKKLRQAPSVDLDVKIDKWADDAQKRLDRRRRRDAKLRQKGK